MIKAQFVIQKPLNINGINSFMDKTVKGVASTTLNMTAGYFPRLTGELERGSYALGVKGSHNEYTLGTTVSYGAKVWEYPQSTNWTNPSTLAQWYYKTFNNRKESIINQAIRGVNVNL